MNKVGDTTGAIGRGDVSGVASGATGGVGDTVSGSGKGAGDTVEVRCGIMLRGWMQKREIFVKLTSNLQGIGKNIGDNIPGGAAGKRVGGVVTGATKGCVSC